LFSLGFISSISQLISKKGFVVVLFMQIALVSHMWPFLDITASTFTLARPNGGVMEDWLARLVVGLAIAWSSCGYVLMIPCVDRGL
jgi:hypothetical protein